MEPIIRRPTPARWPAKSPVPPSRNSGNRQFQKEQDRNRNRLSNAAKVALILFGVAPGMHKRVHVHIDENTEEEKARGENFK